MKISKEEILKMPAGREIDALVAEEIFGYRWVEGILAFGQPCLISPEHYENTKVPIANTNKRKIGGTFPRYSIKISDAWKIIEKIRKSQTPIRLFGDEWYDGGSWRVDIMDIVDEKAIHSAYIESMVNEKHAWEEPNVCLAICRVALLTIIL